MMRIITFLAALCLSWAAVGQPIVGTGPGLTTRTTANVAPSYITPLDARATGTAKRRPSQVTISNGATAMQIDSSYFMNVTMTCTSGQSTITITPGVIPDSVVAYNNAYAVIAPGCGASGAAMLANTTTITAAGTSQTITFSGTASTTVTAQPAMLIITPQGQSASTSTSPTRRVSHNNAIYGQVTYTAGSKTITLPANTLNTNYDYTQKPEYLSNFITDIAIPNAAGANCDQIFLTKVLAVTVGDTVTVSDAPTCTGNNVTKMIWWGWSLFSNADVGKYIELVDGLGAIGSNTNLVTTIASVTDPAHIVLAAAGSTTKTRMFTELTWGPDDTAQFISMAAAARTANMRYLYLPPDVNLFLATGTRLTISPDGWALAWCGEGRIWPLRSVGLNKAVSHSCTNAVSPPEIDNTIYPTTHLRTTLASGATAKALFVGDSQFTSSYSNVGRVALPDYLCDALKNKNPMKTISCQNYSIGGTVWAAFDPTGPTFGNGPGIPQGSSSAWGTWYVTPGNTWISYAQAYCPDVMFMKWGFNDQYEFNWGSFISIMNYTQGTTWRTACGKNPDIIIVTESPPGVADAVGVTHAPDDKLVVMSFLRGWALSCEYRLTNGGCPGLVDIGRSRMFKNHGWTDEDLIPRRAVYNTPHANGNDGPTVSAATYTWPINVYDFGVNVAVFRATATDVPTFWASVGNVDFAWGSGALTTPLNSGTQTGLALPYTGGKMRLNLVGANYQITNYLFDVSQSATVTNTGGGSTITCASACINQGFVNANIELPGAGVASGLYAGVITAINAAGTVITVTPTLTTALTAQVKTMRYYHQAGAAVDTGVAALCTVVTTFCESSFAIHKRGSLVTLYDNRCFNCAPVWQGRVAMFGGASRPTVSITGTFASWKLTTNSSSLASLQTDGRPENGTPYAITMTDSEVWGLLNNTGGVHGGAASVHPGMMGDAVTFAGLFAGLNLNMTSGAATAAVNTPLTGFSYAMGDQQTFLSLTPAGTLATGTVTLPRNTGEGEVITIFSSQIITALTIAAPSGYTLSGTAVATIAANGALTYRRVGTVFYRVQ